MFEALLWILVVLGLGLALIYLLKGRFDGFKTIWLKIAGVAAGAAPALTEFASSLSLWAGDFDWERYMTVKHAGYVLIGFSVLGIVNRVFFTSGPVPWRRDPGDLK